MADLMLEVSGREGTGKEIAKKLRREGKVPAIVYGGHQEPTAVSVDRKSISEMISKSDKGVRSIFLLKLAGSDKQRHVMIKEMQIDPINRRVKHIDFIRVAMDEKVRVSVPVHVTGTAVGVKTGGGLIDFQVRELHIECLPNSIPDEITVDVTNLDVHQFIRISDLNLGESIRVFDDPERVIVSVTLPRAEVAAEGAEETAEPEVIKKGKTEEAAAE